MLARIIILAFGLGASALAHDQNSVKISVEGNERVIRANGIPDHKHGQFPSAHNPNTIRAQSYTFRMPLHPVENDQATRVGHLLFGVALNGVPFDPGTAESWNDDPRSGWHFQARSGKIDLGLDSSNAHVQPTGAYHYHGSPAGLVARLGGDKKMALIGYAADGFPIYSEFDQDGEARSSYALKVGRREGGPGGRYDGTFEEDFEFVQDSGDLDECNGHFGATPENPQGIYHYHITREYPFIGRSFRGTPDASFRHEPHGGPPGRGRGPGNRRPPPRSR